VREWQRLRSHRTAEDAEAELAELVTAGVGQWEEVAPGPKGGRPTKRFVMNRLVVQLPDTTPETESATRPEDTQSGVLSVVSVSESECDDAQPIRRRVRDQAAALIRQARKYDRDLAVTLRDRWRERVAACTHDGGLSEAEAEKVALAELEAYGVMNTVNTDEKGI